MKKLTYILLTFIFILYGCLSIIRLIEKPDPPFEYNSRNSGVHAFDSHQDIDQIFSVDSVNVNSAFQLEFVIDRYDIGSKADIKYSDKAGRIHNSEFEIIPYYHQITFIIATAFVGFTFLLMGFFVVYKKYDNIQGILLYWVLSLYGLATLTSPGHYSVYGDWIGYIIRFFHAASYTIGSLFFILFIISFPVNRLRNKRFFVVFNIIIATIVALLSSVIQQHAILNRSNGSIFEISWNIVLGFLVYSLAAGTYLFIRQFKISGKEERKKLAWITWGLAIGVTPYLFLWVIPDIIGLNAIVNEEYPLLFLVFIPVSLVIAVIKYQILDIELVVKKSFVYSLLIIFISGIYLGLIYLVGYILGTEIRLLNLLAVFIAALLFNPLRNRLYKFADKIFYREKYALDKAITEVLIKAKECLTSQELGKTLISEIEKFIPVKSIAVMVRKNGYDRLRVLKQKNFDELSKNLPALRLKQLTSDFKLPLALERKVEKGIKVDTSMEKIFKRWNINTVIPLLLESNEPIGAIVLGDKLSEMRYSLSDLELLNSIANSAALVLNRLELQEKLVQEQIENEKLEELNRLKSFYVASVSHDLKTPLTSIKVFSELMQSEAVIPEVKKSEYLKIIVGETDRLTRLIDNVLDFTKIDKGIKQYSFIEIDLNLILNDIVKAVQYILQMNKFEFSVKYLTEHLYIKGDPDALKSALFNIITNSVKYSVTNKSISITSGIHNNSAYIEIEDKGMGIPDSDKEHIYKPYFRSTTYEIKGAGLGLTVVKHAMDAHNGTIELTSMINIGTKIRLLFPLIHHN